MKGFKKVGGGGGSKATAAKTLKEIEAEFESKGTAHDLEDGASSAVSESGTLTSSTVASTVDLAAGDGHKEAPWATIQAEKKKHKR